MTGSALAFCADVVGPQLFGQVSPDILAVFSEGDRLGIFGSAIADLPRVSRDAALVHEHKEFSPARDFDDAWAPLA